MIPDFQLGELRAFVDSNREKQEQILAGMSPMDLLGFDASFEMWAHRGQLPPMGEGWRTWLMMAGRGYGKTRAGAEWVTRLALHRPVRIALVAASIDEARKVMVEGVSGILAVGRYKRKKVKWEPSKGELRWPGGSVAQLFSGDHGDGLRGPEHHFAWYFADSRSVGRRGCRGAAAERPASRANCRKLFHCWSEPERGVGRSPVERGRVHDCGLAVCRGGRRNESADSIDR